MLTTYPAPARDSRSVGADERASLEVGNVTDPTLVAEGENRPVWLLSPTRSWEISCSSGSRWYGARRDAAKKNVASGTTSPPVAFYPRQGWEGRKQWLPITTSRAQTTSWVKTALRS